MLLFKCVSVRASASRGVFSNSIFTSFRCLQRPLTFPCPIYSPLPFNSFMSALNICSSFSLVGSASFCSSGADCCCCCISLALGLFTCCWCRASGSCCESLIKRGGQPISCGMLFIQLQAGQVHTRPKVLIIFLYSFTDILPHFMWHHSWHVSQEIALCLSATFLWHTDEHWCVTEVGPGFSDMCPASNISFIVLSFNSCTLAHLCFRFGFSWYLRKLHFIAKIPQTLDGQKYNHTNCLFIRYPKIQFSGTLEVFVTRGGNDEFALIFQWNV